MARDIANEYFQSAIHNLYQMTDIDFRIAITPFILDQFVQG